MNDISDSGTIAALRRQMTVAVARQVAAAGNLANVDTPGYHAKEVTFVDTLSAKLKPANSTFPTSSTKTMADPADAGVPAGLMTQEAEGLPERRDGNNVQLDRELLNMSNAAEDFAAAQTALAAKFRLVRYAINESH